jgi:hypothetical protein
MLLVYLSRCDHRKNIHSFISQFGLQAQDGETLATVGERIGTRIANVLFASIVPKRLRSTWHDQQTRCKMPLTGIGRCSTRQRSY